jgi:hypothetical protein
MNKLIRARASAKPQDRIALLTEVAGQVLLKNKPKNPARPRVR